MLSGENSGTPRSFLQTISESRFNYAAAFVADFTSIWLFGYLGVREPFALPSAALVWLVGFALFSLAEYAIHRWLLHNPKTFLFPLHDAHHKHPNMPASSFFLTGMVVLAIIWTFLRYALGFREAGFFISGFAAAYSYYGIFHHVEHTTRINQIPFRWMQKTWAAHSVHHRLQETNFGVTSSFWDHVFKTYYKNKPRGVPARVRNSS